MAKPQRPVSWRPDRTFVASNAEVDPRWFAEVAWEALTMRQRLVLVARALDWESYAAADPGGPSGAPLPLGALVPPEDVRLLQRLWAERPELTVRVARRDRPGGADAPGSCPAGGHGAGRRCSGRRRG